MSQLFFGVASLGNWRSYRPVFYRVYYDQKGKRRSLLVLSRLGFLAVAASLSHKRNIEYGSIAIITPLSLSTIMSESRDHFIELLRNWPDTFCESVVDEISQASAPVTIYKRSSQEKAVTSVKVRHYGEQRKLEIIYDDETKTEEVSGKEDIIILRELHNHRKASSCKISDQSIPALCEYECALSYTVSSHGSKEPEDRELRLRLNIIPVPVTMTSRLRDGTIVLFRERSTEDVDMESALRASVLKGVEESFSNFLNGDNYDNTASGVDLTVFYDTTHGTNTLLSPLTYVIEILDPLIALKLTRRILEYRGFTYGLRSYLYNSDPVQLGKVGDGGYIEFTLRTNINYYYRELMSGSAMSTTSVPTISGSDARKQLQGILERIARVRGVIDELVSALPEKLDGMAEAERRAMSYILTMYIAKLGMIHWAMIAARYLHTEGRKLPVVLEFDVRQKSQDEVNVSFKRSNELARMLQPHVVVTSIILGREVVAYINALYEALSPCNVHAGAEGRLCFRIDTLQDVLKDLNSKLSNKNKESSDKSSCASLPALLASSLYTEMVEPSARILVLNELERLEKETKKTLDYLLPRGFKLEIDCNQYSNEDKEDILGNKALCFHPPSQVPAKETHIRNFIAHGGFTRLSRDWCLALDEECKAYAVCVEKPLEETVMNKIAHP